MDSILNGANSAKSRRRSVNIGERTVLLPAEYGFCGGVVRALRLLEDALDNRGTRTVWLFGQVIHNDTVNRHYRERGVRAVPDGDVEKALAEADPGDVFVIPAFGLPEDQERRVREYARANGSVVDATCPYVKNIWKFVTARVAEGRTLIIHGKPNHPETRATVSRGLAHGNAVIIVPHPVVALSVAEAVRHRDVSLIPAACILNAEAANLSLLALVNQTTMLHNETLRIRRGIAAAAAESGADLAAADTVCKATQDRQDAAVELCEQGCDLILVVGGFSSSNTNQLYRLAKRHAPTFFIADAESFDATRIVHFDPSAGVLNTDADWLGPRVRRIGLLAGASCPPVLIDAVIERLREVAGGAPTP